ncbi:MAG: hypothetical protein RL693_1422 [Verrucomicrobiota bacterium]|jgi:signal transduction histidine kinase
MSAVTSLSLPSRAALLFGCLWLGASSLPAAEEGAWLRWLSPALRALDQRQTDAQKELTALGAPVIGQTVPEFGIQHTMLAKAPPVSPWVQIDLGESRRFDIVALLPAMVDFQSVMQSAYAFPLRFRLDASDEENFATFTPLMVQTEVDFAITNAAPVIVHTPQAKARYLRLTATKLAEVEGRWTFALSEMMVLGGNRNLALGAKVTHKVGTALPPRWLAQNLTDGRTPLGPPIDRSSMPEFDALFAVMPDAGSPAWMKVDLGKETSVEEVRLHPLHARQGADVPGFRFPLQFRVEIAATEDMKEATVIFDTQDNDFSNPGNNPVTLPAKGARGRFVRVVMLKAQKIGAQDFAISEMEVYAGDRNVARACTVTSSGDPHRNPPRPLSDLTDGFASYGRLMELPQWLNQWERRQQLQNELAALSAQAMSLREEAWQRALGVLITGVTSAGLLLVVWSFRNRRRQRMDQEKFRNQLARDMHDEIGSNLAGISVISELAAQESISDREDWNEIHRIARETTDAMREVLWLVGARQEMGIDLMEHLKLAASRLLPNREVIWSQIATDLPTTWPVESRRQVFLFFKEALTNIVRHAKATRIELSTRVHDGIFELVIRDNGRGFDPAAATHGMGLISLKERAKTMNGTMLIDSSPDRGTTITLRVPVPH